MRSGIRLRRRHRGPTVWSPRRLACQVKDIFTEIVIAPAFEDAALDILSASKNLRLLTCNTAGPGCSQAPEWAAGGRRPAAADPRTRSTAPGDDPAGLGASRPASPPPPIVLADLAFAWRAHPQRQSPNAIHAASGLATVGVGMGQVNRVDAACRLGGVPGG